MDVAKPYGPLNGSETGKRMLQTIRCIGRTAGSQHRIDVVPLLTNMSLPGSDEIMEWIILLTAQEESQR